MKFYTYLITLILFATSTYAAPVEPKKVDHAPAEATLIPLSENWLMSGDVPVHSLLISLQGLANRDYPRIYLEYPLNWQWEIVHPLIKFLEHRHGVKFNKLGMDDADTALSTQKDVLFGIKMSDHH